MARPRLQPDEAPLSVTTSQRGSRWTARAYVTDSTGRRRRPRATGATEDEARANLMRALAEHEPPSEVSKATLVTALAELWFAELDDRVTAGELSPGSLRVYRSHWDNHVDPGLGGLTLAQCTTQRLDTFLKGRRKDGSNAVASGCRRVLTGMFGVAVRYDVFAVNPVAGCAPIPGAGGHTERSLSEDEAVALWWKLMELSRTPRVRHSRNGAYRVTQIDRVIPDLWLLMLGTGLRIGQAVAPCWPFLDLEAGVAELGHNITRVKGQGLVLSKGRSKSQVAVMDLPEQVVAMLAARERLAVSPLGPVFPSTRGGFLDPSNVGHWMREAFDMAGWPNVTPHYARRSLGSALDAAGLSLTDIAGRLQHGSTRTTERYYVRKRRLNPAVVAATEAMLPRLG